MSINDYREKPPFSGTVDVDGTMVEIENGEGEFEGKKYFVSKDGKFVIDEQHNIVGKIVDGKFAPIEKSDVQELIASGMIADPSKQAQQPQQPMQQPQQPMGGMMGGGMMGGAT